MTWDGKGFFQMSPLDRDIEPAESDWIDLTCYVNDELSEVNFFNGRQDDLDGSEPARLQLWLNNHDDRFTYGNPLSPYASWWAPGRLCRYFDRIAGVTVELFRGYLEVPTESLITAGVEQRVAISAVDRLGRLASTPAFVSTLGAHIAGSGRGALVGYWPLLDQTLPLRPLVGRLPLEAAIETGSSSPLEARPQILPREGDSVPGDDVRPLRLVSGLNGGVATWSYSLTSNPSETWSLAASQVVTGLVWVCPDFSAEDGPDVLTLSTFDGLIDVFRNTPAFGADWHVTSPLGTLTGSATAGVAAGSDVWTMVGFRFGFSPNILELWVNDRVYVGTLSGSFGGPSFLGHFKTGPQISGSVAHLQLYIGAPGDWTHEDALAQLDVGRYGLERQTTGARIRSIARYTGVPESQLAQIDEGTTVMQRAKLAGQTPLASMTDAERTEQGLLYAAGAGGLVFKDRKRLYNI